MAGGGVGALPWRSKRRPTVRAASGCGCHAWGLELWCLLARLASVIAGVVERGGGGGDICGEMTRVGSSRRSKMLEY